METTRKDGKSYEGYTQMVYIVYFDCHNYQVWKRI